MKKTGVQFHATHGDLLLLIRNIVEDLNLNFCVVSQNPFHATAYSLDNFTDRDILERFEKIRDCFIYFSQKKFSVDFESFSDFRENNNCCISFLIGKQTCDFLQESWFSFLGEDGDEYLVAKKISSVIKNYTFAGLIPFSPGQEISSKINKNFRYTKEAKILYENGVSLTAMVGISHFAIPKP
jgi:hypothetical protein